MSNVGGRTGNVGSDSIDRIITHTSAWVAPWRTVTSYAVPVGTSILLGIELTEMRMAITPTKAGNIVDLEFNIFAEYSSDSQMGYVVTRNLEPLLNASDGTIATRNNYAVTAIPTYDNQVSDTPQSICIKFADHNSLATASTYSIFAVSTGAITTTLYVNGATPASADESGQSSARIIEYVT